MANSFLNDEDMFYLNNMTEKLMLREVTLINMKDELIKEWITELLNKNKALELKVNKMHGMLGGNCFNPIIDE